MNVPIELSIGRFISVSFRCVAFALKTEFGSIAVRDDQYAGRGGAAPPDIARAALKASVAQIGRWPRFFRPLQVLSERVGSGRCRVPLICPMSADAGQAYVFCMFGLCFVR